LEPQSTVLPIELYLPLNVIIKNNKKEVIALFILFF